jgi:transposase
MPITRSRVTLPGVKPVQQCEPAYESFYLYGAVEPATGERLFVERPTLDSEGFQDFLDAFSWSFPGSLNVLILDNGAFHKAKALRIPDNVELLFLPPYSPELNPIERFWQDVKDDIAFHRYETLAALKQRMRRKLANYVDEAVASLTGYEYLLEAEGA